MQPIRIVLVDTSHPGNIGAVARAMKNMGLGDLVLVRPQQFPSAEATARASGADDLLARARVTGSLAGAVAGCGLVLGSSARPRSANWRVLDPRAAAAELGAAAGSRPAAVLFGNERNGLSNEDLAACHALVNIPANPEYESLNLAQAVQIVCYELRMACGPAVRRLAPEAPDAAAEELAHLRGHLGRVLRRLGFPEQPNAAQIEARVMRLVHRAVPDEKEVQILRGVLSAVEQALDREDAR
jgi:TrmH family RNA methyltransferase